VVIQKLGNIIFWIGFLILFAVGVIIVFIADKDSRARSFTNLVMHLMIILMGWGFGRWRGLFCISLFMIFFFYYFISHLAMVVVPASDPDDKNEWVKRILYFYFWLWGRQFPAWVVPESASRVTEKRINGDNFTKWTPPGLIWAYSHQAVGISTGISFSRVESPGTVFTEPYERPYQSVIDLRVQLRTFWIDVVSSDGIPYKGLMFTSFRVDKDEWNKDLFIRILKVDQGLKDARKPDYTRGNFPISRPRIKTLLSSTGIKSKIPKPSDSKTSPSSAEPAITHWDEIALYAIEKAACDVLSKRRFDETWLPAADFRGACAADEIASAIKDLCFFPLLTHGIRFYSCRLVDFKFARVHAIDTGEVELQQIAAWQADWQRETMQIRAQGKADAELLKQHANARAWVALLTSIAESLKEAHAQNPDLSASLISMRFLKTLEEMLQQQPEAAGKNGAYMVISNWKRNLSDQKG
jgi:hypothetical protein